MAGWRVGLALGVAVALAACTAAPSGQLSILPATTSASRLTLHLENPWRASRAVLYAAGTGRARLTVDGPGQAEPFETTVSLAAGATTIAATDVPTGAHRIVTLEALEADGDPVPGTVLRAAGALAPGANTLEISALTTAVGEVATDLLAKDRADGTQVLDTVDLDQLETAVASYARTLGASHFAFLDAEAIADAVAASGGQAPAATAAFARKPGRVVVHPAHWPPGVEGLVAVADPASQLVFLAEGAPAVVAGVAPGTWSITVTPQSPGLSPYIGTVTVEAGATANLDVALGTAPAVLADWPFPLGGAIAGVLDDAGTPTLYVAGGTTYVDVPGTGDGVSDHVAVQKVTGNTFTYQTALPDALVGAAAAVHGNTLYWFGGSNGVGFTDGVWAYTPGGAATRVASLPTRLASAQAATIGETIYLAGGMVAVDDPETPATPAPMSAGVRPLFDQAAYDQETGVAPLTAMFAFDPQTNQLDALEIQPVLPAERDSASAVVDGRWYFFGGHDYAAGYANGGVVAVSKPSKATTAFTPGANASWAGKADMPTARSGAAAIAVDSKIYVIGGAGYMGVPSRAVEVYDPAANTWEVRPPLATGRAFPVVAYLGGKILVAGGTLGENQDIGVPVAAVEAIAP